MKIIAAFVFSTLCLTSAFAVSNPLSNLVSQSVKSSSCPAANPSNGDFCSYPSSDPNTFINASSCVCTLMKKGGLCSPQNLKIEIARSESLDEEEFSAEASVLPSGETVQDCVAQVKAYFTQCLHR